MHTDCVLPTTCCETRLLHVFVSRFPKTILGIMLYDYDYDISSDFVSTYFMGLYYFVTVIIVSGSSAGISFTHGPILGFFAPQGRHVAPIKVKFDREERTYGPLLDRFRGGVYGPQN